MKIFTLMVLMLFSQIFFSGCRSEGFNQGPVVGDNNHLIEEIGYPITDQIDMDNGYPVPSNEIETGQTGPEFNIHQPVRDGDLTVTGDGPAGVPIILVNVSEMGEMISESIITDDGVFEFRLDQPLRGGHSIGIQLGDISRTGFNESDFIYSDTYYERPYIGILFDIVSVQN